MKCRRTTAIPTKDTAFRNNMGPKAQTVYGGTTSRLAMSVKQRVPTRLYVGGGAVWPWTYRRTTVMMTRIRATVSHSAWRLPYGMAKRYSGSGSRGGGCAHSNSGLAMATRTMSTSAKPKQNHMQACREESRCWRMPHEGPTRGPPQLVGLQTRVAVCEEARGGGEAQSTYRGGGGFCAKSNSR